jgi:hypothetical protein
MFVTERAAGCFMFARGCGRGWLSWCLSGGRAGGHVFFTGCQNDDLPGATVVLPGAIGGFVAGVNVTTTQQSTPSAAPN